MGVSCENVQAVPRWHAPRAKNLHGVVVVIVFFAFLHVCGGQTNSSILFMKHAFFYFIHSDWGWKLNRPRAAWLAKYPESAGT